MLSIFSNSFALRNLRRRAVRKLAPDRLAPASPEDEQAEEGNRQLGQENVQTLGDKEDQQTGQSIPQPVQD